MRVVLRAATLSAAPILVASQGAASCGGGQAYHFDLAMPGKRGRVVNRIGDAALGVASLDGCATRCLDHGDECKAVSYDGVAAECWLLSLKWDTIDGSASRDWSHYKRLESCRDTPAPTAAPTWAQQLRDDNPTVSSETCTALGWDVHAATPFLCGASALSGRCWRNVSRLLARAGR